MITINIFTALGFIFGAVFVYNLVTDSCSDLFEYATSPVLLAAFILMGASIGILVAIIIPSKTEVVKSTYQMELLQDGDNVNGSFFLGTGHIEGSMQYVYYFYEDGFYKMNKVGYEDAKIKYTNDKPFVEIFKKVQVEDYFWNKFSIVVCENKNYTFNVPHGSINQNYTLNGK